MIIFTSYEKEWQTNLNSLCRCATYRRKVVVAKDKNKRPYFRYHLPAKGNTVDSDLCSNSTAVWNKIKLLTLACFALWEYNTETWCILNGWLHRWAFPAMWCPHCGSSRSMSSRSGIALQPSSAWEGCFAPKLPYGNTSAVWIPCAYVLISLKRTWCLQMFITPAAELVKVICSAQDKHFKCHCGTVTFWILLSDHSNTSLN